LVLMLTRRGKKLVEVVGVELQLVNQVVRVIHHCLSPFGWYVSDYQERCSLRVQTDQIVVKAIL